MNERNERWNIYVRNAGTQSTGLASSLCIYRRKRVEMQDGKYIMSLEGTEQDVVVSTLLVDQYPCKDTAQFVCVPYYFPIPLDSWILKDAIFRPAQPTDQNVEREMI